jgi:hypothetical protein
MTPSVLQSFNNVEKWLHLERKSSGIPRRVHRKDDGIAQNKQASDTAQDIGPRIYITININVLCHFRLLRQPTIHRSFIYSTFGQ